MYMPDSSTATMYHFFSLHNLILKVSYPLSLGKYAAFGPKFQPSLRVIQQPRLDLHHLESLSLLLLSRNCDTMTQGKKRQKCYRTLTTHSNCGACKESVEHVFFLLKCHQRFPETNFGTISKDVLPLKPFFVVAFC